MRYDDGLFVGNLAAAKRINAEYQGVVMYREYVAGGKKVFLVRDHALALLCWRNARLQGVLPTATTLVHIDAHTDFTFNKEHEQRSKSLLLLDDHDAQRFVDSLAKDNSEFIVCAMLAGIVGDGICVYARRCNDFGKFSKGTGVTTDHLTVGDHTFFLCNTQNIGGLTNPGSFIADPLRHLDTYSLFHNSPQIILDIDLDFFTYINDQVYVKSRKDIVLQLTSRAFQHLWEKAAVVTIALEPGCCGSEEQCLEILNLLNDLVLKQEGILEDAKGMF